MSELFQEPERDGFKTETPLRCFTSYSLEGAYLIGKGFKPSLQHLATYLDALERVEGFRLVQILEAATAHPTIVMHRTRHLGEDELLARLHDHGVREYVRSLMDDEPLIDTERLAVSMEIGGKMSAAESMAGLLDQFPNGSFSCDDPTCRYAKHLHFHTNATREPPFVDDVDPASRQPYDDWVKGEIAAGREVSLARPVVMYGELYQPSGELTSDIYPVADDPINPKHYAGRECADIGERLSANGYQILKYCWRLGKKDDPCQELGKAIWYGESEQALIASMRSIRRVRPNTMGLKPDKVTQWFEDRINGQPTFTRNIARMLWAGYGKRELQAIIEAITEQKFHMDCGRGLAI